MKRIQVGDKLILEEAHRCFCISKRCECNFCTHPSIANLVIQHVVIQQLLSPQIDEDLWTQLLLIGCLFSIKGMVVMLLPNAPNKQNKTYTSLFLPYLQGFNRAFPFVQAVRLMMLLRSKHQCSFNW